MKRFFDKRYLGYLAFIALISLAFIQRVHNVNDLVFPAGDETRLLGVDPHFYIRHVETCVKNFPKVQKFDHATHYPNGVNADAAGLYTIFMASSVMLTQAFSTGEVDAAAVIAWIPPILGALTCFIIMLLLWKMHGIWASLIAGIIYVIFPGLSLPRSILGFPDHHVAEFLLAIWLLYSCFCLFTSKKNYKFYIPAWESLPFLFIFLVWPGSPLYLIILGVALVWMLAFTFSDADQVKKHSVQLLRFFGTTVFSFILIMLIWPDILAIPNPGVQQKILYGLGFLCLGLPAYIWLGHFVTKKVKIPNQVISFGFIGLVAAVLYFTITNTPEGDEIRFWFHFKGTGLIESGEVNLDRFYNVGALPGILSILAIFYYLLLHIFTKNVRKIELIVSVFAAFYSYLWLNTFDMGYMLNPIYAILATIFAVEVYNHWEKWVNGFRSKLYRPILRYAPIFVFILTLFYPFLWAGSSYPNYMTGTYLSSSRFYQESWFDTLRWLKDHSPEPTLPTDKIIKKGDPEYFKESEFNYPSGAYGVVTAWDYGNLVNYIGKRTPVWSRWPAGPQTKWMTSTSEQESLETICPSCTETEEVKYAIVNSKMAGSYFTAKTKLAGRDPSKYQQSQIVNVNGQNTQVYTYGPKFEQSMVRKLHRYDGYGLSHYRLVYESPEEALISYLARNNGIRLIDKDILNEEQRRGFQEMLKSAIYFTEQGHYYGGYIASQIKIYEIVKGAAYILKVQPNSLVKISLPLQSNTTKRKFFFSSNIRAGNSDELKITLPYSTGELPNRSDIFPLGNYQIEYVNPKGEAIQKSLVVPESAVQGGVVISLD